MAPSQREMGWTLPPDDADSIAVVELPWRSLGREIGERLHLRGARRRGRLGPSAGEERTQEGGRRRRARAKADGATRVEGDIYVFTIITDDNS